MTLIIPGDVASLKNSKQLIYVRGRPMLIPSKAYKAWHKASLEAIRGSRRVDSIPLSVNIALWSKTARKDDLDNKAGSILDLLRDAGIIPDDNWSVVSKLTVEYIAKDATNPRAEVTITQL